MQVILYTAMFFFFSIGSEADETSMILKVYQPEKEIRFWRSELSCWQQAEKSADTDQALLLEAYNRLIALQGNPEDIKAWQNLSPDLDLDVSTILPK